jgi:hypothetical protein
LKFFKITHGLKYKKSLNSNKIKFLKVVEEAMSELDHRERLNMTVTFE